MTGSPKPEEKAEKKAPTPTPEQIESEIEVTRVELVDTVNALADRLNPKALAEHAGESAKQAAQDTATLIKGGGMPTPPRHSRNVKILLGAAAAAALAVGLIIFRKK